MAKMAAAGAMLVWLACAGVPEGWAQQAAPEVIDLAPVVVSGAQPGPGMLDTRFADQWMGAARESLARHPVTFATVSVHSLVEPGGYLERLRLAGYMVESP
ncbi:hypothetical protein J7J08_02855 [Stenotrophomonas sp. ISL-67]|uniref:hypothetical protein n=1 Tax=Stenotrophomonas sp. ISL-67 TaxID=2819171 RepID=UPI001BEA322A|nr:hypothetical protein [Stenotrophomonas sp. ISL-67]MBT2766570.1 hypothetical protein [Stenotrophomonas sp. ISL-67]